MSTLRDTLEIKVEVTLQARLEAYTLGQGDRPVPVFLIIAVALLAGALLVVVAVLVGALVG